MIYDTVEKSVLQILSIKNDTKNIRFHNNPIIRLFGLGEKHDIIKIQFKQLIQNLTAISKLNFDL